MTVIVLNSEFSICKLSERMPSGQCGETFFYAQTKDEFSLVCPSDSVPPNAVTVDSGWRAFRIAGALDFSLVGILSKIATLLADNDIPIFAISTFDTDYVLTKNDKFDRALSVLRADGYDILK